MSDYGQTKIHSALLEFANEPFEWGKNDCIAFTARIIERVTHINPMHILGTTYEYDTEEGAQEIIDRHGDMEGLMIHALGKPCHKWELNAGSPILANIPLVGDIAGMWLSNTAIVKSKNGVVEIGMRHIKVGWLSCLKH